MTITSKDDKSVFGDLCREIQYKILEMTDDKSSDSILLKSNKNMIYDSYVFKMYKMYDSIGILHREMFGRRYVNVKLTKKGKIILDEMRKIKELMSQ